MSEVKEDEEKKPVDKPLPTMISYANNIINTLKTHCPMNLPYDQTGRIINFASRPCDKIFKDAQKKIDAENTFLRRGSPSVHLVPDLPVIANDDCPIGINDRSRSEQPGELPAKDNLSPATGIRPRSTQPIVQENNNGTGEVPAKKMKTEISAKSD